MCLGRTDNQGVHVNVIGIDPGPFKTAWVVIGENGNPISFAHCENDQAWDDIAYWVSLGSIPWCEMIASYGMPVGAEVFETCVWIGRFIEASSRRMTRVGRLMVKIWLCKSAKANDANIRQALIDLYEPIGGGKIPQIGVKSNPGPLFGVSGDVWAALAVARYGLEIERKKNAEL